MGNQEGTIQRHRQYCEQDTELRQTKQNTKQKTLKMSNTDLTKKGMSTDVREE